MKEKRKGNKTGPEQQKTRREARANKILTVAAHFFSEKGYVGTSVEEIAKKAKINKALVYYYFDNKAVLLYEITSGPLKKMTEVARPIAASNLEPREKLQALIANHISWQLSHLGLTGIGHVERKNLPAKLLRTYVSMRDEYEKLFRDVIDEGIEKGRFSFPDGKMAALFTLGLLTSITQWYKASGKYSPGEIESFACNYIMGALAKQS